MSTVHLVVFIAYILSLNLIITLAAEELNMGIQWMQQSVTVVSVTDCCIHCIHIFSSSAASVVIKFSVQFSIHCHRCEWEALYRGFVCPLPKKHLSIRYDMNFDWLIVESEQGDNNQSGQWSIVCGVDGVCPRVEVLLRARSAGAERPVRHHHRQRWYTMGHHRARHLESSRKTVHETGRLPGDIAVGIVWRIWAWTAPPVSW